MQGPLKVISILLPCCGWGPRETTPVTRSRSAGHVCLRAPAPQHPAFCEAFRGPRFSVADMDLRAHSGTRLFCEHLWRSRSSSFLKGFSMRVAWDAMFSWTAALSPDYGVFQNIPNSAPSKASLRVVWGSKEIPEATL